MNQLESRKYFEANLISIIANSNHCNISDNASLSIALDSSWGTGKTIFLECLVDEMQKTHKDDIKVVHYNAWDYDYIEDAFLALSLSISDTIRNEQPAKDFIRKASLAIAATTTLLGREIIKKVSDGIINTENLAKAYESIFAQHKSKTAISKFQKCVEELVPRCNGNGKLVIVIDELDRCRPLFAIRTLEVIKHFFNLKNVVFVFGLDMSELSHSISTIYGSGMNSSGYLRRFFDLHLKLPTPMTKEYLALKLPKCTPEEIHNYAHILDILSITLREINSIVMQFRMIMTTHDNLTPQAAEIFFFLLAFKYKYPSKYDLILHNLFSLKGPDKSELPEAINTNLVRSSEQIMKLIGFLSGGNNLKKLSYVESERLFEVSKLLNVKLSDYPDITLGQYLEKQIEVANFVVD